MSLDHAIGGKGDECRNHGKKGTGTAGGAAEHSIQAGGYRAAQSDSNRKEPEDFANAYHSGREEEEEEEEEEEVVPVEVVQYRDSGLRGPKEQARKGKEEQEEAGEVVASRERKVYPAVSQVELAVRISCPARKIKPVVAVYTELKGEACLY